MLFVGCFTSQEHASVSQRRICTDKCTCTEIVSCRSNILSHPVKYTDTGQTSPRTDPGTPGTWQGTYWSTNFQVTGMTGPWKRTKAQDGVKPKSAALASDAFTTKPTSWTSQENLILGSNTDHSSTQSSSALFLQVVFLWCASRLHPRGHPLWAGLICTGLCGW